MTDRLPVPEASEFRCHVPIQVRFRDLDAMGHVNNAVYVSYLEIGRAAYLREALGAAMDLGTAFDRFPFIIAEITCRFLLPAGMDDGLHVHLRVDRVGERSFDFLYRVDREQGGQAVAAGRSVQVGYDYRTGQVAPVSGDFVAAVERFEGRRLRPAGIG
jgi:acyl-CoA thioester hydrolase